LGLDAVKGRSKKEKLGDVGSFVVAALFANEEESTHAIAWARDLSEFSEYLSAAMVPGGV
jgi:hypothetical protein